MFRRLLPVFALCATPLWAETSHNLALDLPCDVTPDETSCSRSFACFGAEGRWFSGRGIGRGTGTLDGFTNDGTACTGTWTNSNGFGVGQADFTCDDGTQGTVYYVLQDGDTGTAVGRGKTTKGDRLEVWTGEHVLEFLKDPAFEGAAVLKCGPHDILIS